MPRELILDHLQQLWVGTESTFGAGPAAAPAAGDAIDHISIDGSPVKKRVIPQADQTGNRGAKAPIRGAYDPMSLRLQAHLKGSGSATTAPDAGPLFKAAGFTETVGGSDVTYSRTLTPDTSGWLWAATKDGGMGRMYGGIAWGEISLPDLGTDAAKIEFAGNASHCSTVYRTTVGTGGITDVATSLPLAEGHGWVIGNIGAYVEIEESGTTEVLKVTGLTGDTATVERDVLGTGASAFTAAATISAYSPARTVASTTPISETMGSFAVDDGGGASARKTVKASLSVKTGLDHLDKEAFSENRNGLVPMRYGEDGARLTVDFIYTTGSSGVTYLHAHHNSASELAVVTTIGSSAGNRCVVTMPTAQVVDLSAPDGADGARKGTVIFGAYSTDGADISFKFN